MYLITNRSNGKFPSQWNPKSCQTMPILSTWLFKGMLQILCVDTKSHLMLIPAHTNVRLFASSEREQSEESSMHMGIKFYVSFA